MAEIQPYKKIEKIGEELWVMDGEWYETTFARRMTIMRLPSKELVIHNAIRLQDEDYALLNELGQVKYVIVPNKIHASEAKYYGTQYPEAQIFAPLDAVKSVGKRCKIHGFLPVAWPAYLNNEISCFEIKGTRWFTEIAFFHKKSKTLILTDLVFNMQMEVKGFEKMVFKLINIYKRFGPSLSVKYLFSKKWSEVQNSFREILKWDFDRVIMNHGSVLSTGGKEAIRKSFEI